MSLGFFEGLEPMDGAIDAIKEMKEQGMYSTEQYTERNKISMI